MTPKRFSTPPPLRRSSPHLDLALLMFKKLLASSVELEARSCNQLLVSLRKADMQNEFRNVFDELSKRGFPTILGVTTFAYTLSVLGGSWMLL
ncbi:hypothetical protein HPP92_002274 [Vanilla planifolia]|uniref:Uncharacterized protein n=1 Tax=Vanilla planifolia TaxID=51239 RepID=A0A835S562_VANPL|nr:hypothetical protein HPP92_002274 [Vanilla planifolia]